MCTCSQSDLARFEARLKRTPDGCLEWTGARTGAGYGAIKIGGRTIHTHRLAAMLAGLEIDDLIVRHTCDNPPCCESGHLLVGTQRDNMADRSARGRWRGPAHGNRREMNGRAKLTNRQVDEIRGLLGQHSQRELAGRFGVSKSAIGHISTGRNHPKED